MPRLPDFEVHPVVDNEVEAFAAILKATAESLVKRGDVLWLPDALTPERLRSKYRPEQLYLGLLKGRPVASMILEDSDLLFWPEAPPGTSLFLHNLAVLPDLRGEDVGYAMLDAAVEEARSRGRSFLRLDCDADRSRLISYYRRYGFHQVDTRIAMGSNHARFEFATGDRPQPPDA